MRGRFVTLPPIREDGLPHHASYDPKTGTSTCLADCPSCNANGFHVLSEF
jgi:hypothetical protein